MSKMHEQLEKNKGVALKASSKEKKSSSSTSRTMVEEDSDMNMTPEQRALFVRKFNKMFKRVASSSRTRTKTRSRRRGLPRDHVLGVARRVISLRNAPT
jgi:hypothetical protein